jgi:hypothetical protein
MGMTIEDLEDHEGYAARRLPRGTLTSTWTQDTAAFDAYVGTCTDADQHPTTEAGRIAPEDQCEHAHTRPLLAATVPARVTELVDNLPVETAELADHRPLAARAVASGSPPGLSTSCKRTATTELHHRLDALGHQQPERGLSL